jgi:hypothetical protein
MNILPKSLLVQDNEWALSADIMRIAASIAQEISEKWPFAVARLRLELFGALGRPDLQSAIGKALTLGLSGIVDGAADARKIAGIFALQDRMMAVRLVGRRLVAFHPGRDLQFRPGRLCVSADRLRASVWSTKGELVGKTERLAWSADQISGSGPAIAMTNSHDASMLTSNSSSETEGSGLWRESP